MRLTRNLLLHRTEALQPLRKCPAHIRYVSQSTSAPNEPSTSSEQQRNRTTHFGFKTVPESEKETLVRGVFSNVAEKYDLMNDAMSLGVHRLWKDAYVSGLDPGRRGALKCLDVAGGTGDIALRILDHAREKYADREAEVTVLDINPEMLKEGFKRFKKTMYHNSQFSVLRFFDLFSDTRHLPTYPAKLLPSPRSLHLSRIQLHESSEQTPLAVGICEWTRRDIGMKHDRRPGLYQVMGSLRTSIGRIFYKDQVRKR